MPKKPKSGLPAPSSYFDGVDFDEGVAAMLDRIAALYQSDEIPWVIGYSGGKDSTAVLQLVWLMLARFEPEQITKDVHVITTDTLVENPIVAAWVERSLEQLEKAAGREGLPIHPHRLTPDIKNTFWVNLIGRGYPAPRPKFRWCTERLKIQPANDFIKAVVKEHGEAIVVLGTRKAESAARAQVMNRLEKESVRDHLRPHTMLPNSYVFSPIEQWSNDDVWLFLAQIENPWGHSNIDLVDLYRGATADRECPLVVETGTPSCGDSRFGCWVCTLVEQDKSMAAMIKNDDDKEWMLPLLQLRDALIPRGEGGAPKDRHLRDFRRMSGHVHLMGDEPVPGPYTQEVRGNWLRKLLEAQKYVQEYGPEEVSDLHLISLDEMREIRRLWVNEKHEIEDDVPRIYREVLGEPFPDAYFTEDLPIGAEEIALLREICAGEDLHFQLTRELLSVERQHRNLVRRSGLFTGLEKALKKNFFDDAADATDRALDLRKAIEAELAAILPDPYIQSIEEPSLPGLEDESVLADETAQ